MTIHKRIGVFIDAETGEPIGGLTATVLEDFDGSDTLHVGGRVFDVLNIERALKARIGGGIIVYLYACRVRERFMLPQEPGASLTAQQRAEIAKPWWTRWLKL